MDYHQENKGSYYYEDDDVYFDVYQDQEEEDYKRDNLKKIKKNLLKNFSNILELQIFLMMMKKNSSYINRKMKNRNLPKFINIHNKIISKISNINIFPGTRRQTRHLLNHKSLKKE